jgi:hypothetical protein
MNNSSENIKSKVRIAEEADIQFQKGSNPESLNDSQQALQ